MPSGTTPKIDEPEGEAVRAVSILMEFWKMPSVGRVLATLAPMSTRSMVLVPEMDRVVTRMALLETAIERA